MARKQDKLRPYRVDYFIIDEMKDNDMALVRSVVVRAVTAEGAVEKVLDGGNDLPTTFNQMIVVVHAARFYKKLVHKKDVYKAVEDLFAANTAVKVMEGIEAYRAKKASEAAAAVAATSGPTSPATVAVIADLKGMVSHDAHEQAMDTFVPTSPIPDGKRFPDPTNAPIAEHGDDISEAILAYDNVFPPPVPKPSVYINDPMPGAPNLNPFVVTPGEPLSLQVKVLAFAGIMIVVLSGLIYFLRH